MSRLEMRKFSQKIHSVITFVASPDFGETLVDVMHPSYLANMAPIIKAAQAKGGANMPAHVDIEVRPVGNPYFAKLVVLHAEDNKVFTKLLDFVDLSGEQDVPKQAPMVKEANMGGFKIERVGAWVRIVCTEDGSVTKTGFRSMEDAKKWAADNLQVKA